ncbi:FtsW/RodA/SpoVE family cell cycle protein [Coprothermobacteraceae bacterium]|nr:FtsW/RodA/SpoVE family cell cycle protein [Coprothermobacteraceae bacterium]
MSRASAAVLSYIAMLSVFLLGLLVWPSEWLSTRGLVLYVGALTVCFWGSFLFFKLASRGRLLHRLHKLVAVLLVVLLLATLVVGESRYGSKRWLFGLQTSEIAKFLLAPPFYVTDGALLGYGFLSALLVVGQPDLGTAIIMLSSVLVAWLIRRFRLNERAWAAVLGTVAALPVFFASSLRLRQVVVAIIMPNGNALLHEHWAERILNWVDPLRDPFGQSFQTLAGLTSLAYSASFGKGVGSMFVLPVSWADYAFAELVRHGSILLGVIALALIGVLLYLLLEHGGSMKYYVGTLIVMHLLINMYSIGNVLPATGVPFPFIGRALQNSCVLAALLGGALGES